MAIVRVAWAGVSGKPQWRLERKKEATSVSLCPGPPARNIAYRARDLPNWTRLRDIHDRTQISLHVTFIDPRISNLARRYQTVRTCFFRAHITDPQKHTYSKAWKNFSCHDCHHPPMTRLRSLDLDLLSCLMTWTRLQRLTETESPVKSYETLNHSHVKHACTLPLTFLPCRETKVF